MTLAASSFKYYSMKLKCFNYKVSLEGTIKRTRSYQNEDARILLYH